MEKELALAIDFKKAPKELQDAAAEYYAAQKSLVKLGSQLDAKKEEIAQAEKAKEAVRRKYRAALDAWTPEVG